MQQVEIRVKGQIDRHWSDWMGGLTITHTEQGESVLTGTIRDQVALRGLLSRITDLGLELILVAVTGINQENKARVNRHYFAKGGDSFQGQCKSNGLVLSMPQVEGSSGNLKKKEVIKDEKESNRAFPSACTTSEPVSCGCHTSSRR